MTQQFSRANPYEIWWGDHRVAVLPARANPSAASGLHGSAGYSCREYVEADDETQSRMLQGLALDLLMQGYDPVQLHQEFSKIDAWVTMALLLPFGEYLKTQTPDGKWNVHNP